LQTKKLVSFRSTKVWAFRCEICGRYIENVSQNWNLLGAFRKELICPVCWVNQRNDLVAIDGHHISKIRSVRPDMLKSSQEISNNLYVLKVRTKWARMVLRYLNYLARKEQSAFRIMPRREFENYILMSKEKVIGYLAWTWKNLPRLGQIFIVREERRKGYASTLVQHFVDEQCRTPNERGFLFGVESPNEATLGLLVKLGYAREEGDKIVGLKVGFVGSW